MDTRLYPKRAIRVPADNCPDCNGSDTYATVATFEHGFHPDELFAAPQGIEVSYRCRRNDCRRSWITSWAMEFTA